MLVVPRAWLESPTQGVTKAMVAAGVSAVAKSSLSVWGVKSWLESAQHPVETPAGAGVYLGECMAPNSETRTGQVLVRLGSGEVAAFGKAVVKPATNVLQGSWAHSQCRVWKSDQAAALVGAALAKPLKNSGGKTGHDAVQTLAAAGHATYVVGGLVRDALRGEPGNDIDVTFTCSNVTVAKVCGDAGFKIPSYSPNPVSGLVELGHENPNEDDGKIQGKQFVVSNCGKTYSPPPPKTKGACAVEDSVYRDFACNALFYDPINGVVLDPTGIGARDAIEKRLSIPAPKARWQEWADHQAAAVLRYWKFRSRGYTPADDATRAFVLAQAKAVEAGTIAPAIYGSISGMSATKRAQFKAVCVEDMGQGWWDTHMKSKVGF
ncbi:MAG: hypothetical protein EKK55_18285 [Rhodocyclaceae bacterium]|nr:MAG: hypothetical protein EKK55_18285 [Rhodocyclaceae bacterium]